MWQNQAERSRSRGTSSRQKQFENNLAAGANNVGRASGSEGASLFDVVHGTSNSRAMGLNARCKYFIF